MTKFKYLKIKNNQKIRYLSNNYTKNLYVVFLHGFMSDVEGEKPKTFLSFCKKNKIGFLAVEYSGHGKSSGEFTRGNISKWTSDTKLAIKKLVKKNDFIFAVRWFILAQNDHTRFHGAVVKKIWAQADHSFN